MTWDEIFDLPHNERPAAEAAQYDAWAADPAIHPRTRVQCRRTAKWLRERIDWLDWLDGALKRELSRQSEPAPYSIT